ncbi:MULTISPECIES: MBL fold metallo-hydrolase [Olivibacter]|uniref:MBL fold metallo-hydrolase n=1 Tax=Olivibacter jilunii TaxID=985016 RepID=A0ABW6AYV2_9SPHI|nr:MBL fold metallo-hydrolase [Olivibacter sp. UJ_SKK_5.1]MDX3913442.1 MBL fold metallo-hydrolase [Pseudosphingobacterium sp.]
MNLYTIEARLFKLDGGAMFGVVPKSIWQRTNPPDENNLCTWAARLLLIETGDRLILIDTGLGDKQDAKFFGHYQPHGSKLDDSLAKYGFQKSDITDVLLTHLHFDHVGGAVERRADRLIPAFENATYWTNQKHWQWAIYPNDRERASFLKENILPLQDSGKLQFIEENEKTFFTKEIQIRFTYGHTEAMMLPQISYNGKTILYMADLLPSIGHIPLPYIMSYDMFPLKTLEEKKTILEEAFVNNYILFLEHDPLIECCTLKQTEKGLRLDKTFKLQDIWR